MNTDPIADLLTRIRNGERAKHAHVYVPYSTAKHEIAKILKKENFVGEISITKGQKAGEDLKIVLLEKKHLTNLKRISKPGQRIYVKSKNIRTVLNGLGISLISTSQGIMTDKEARKKSIGGEIICEIY